MGGHSYRRVPQRLDLRLQIFKPILRAYALGYASSVLPRLLEFLRVLRRKDKTVQEKLDLLLRILKTSTQVNRFPASCAIIVGGATLLPRLLRSILVALLQLVGANASSFHSVTTCTRLRFITTFLSAWLSFSLLNRDKEWARKRAQSLSNSSQVSIQGLPNQHHLPPPRPAHPKYAGKTIDFTAFAFTRAADVLVLTIWLHTRSHPYHPEKLTPRLANLARRLADSAIFATSAAIIMWSWFYSPPRLPHAYNTWISSAASIDPRLVTALRLARQGDFVYGLDTGQAPLLSSLCSDLNLPRVWGDPAVTIPVPCEVVHMGTGPSCEYHALSRFLRAWSFSMRMYLPVQLLVRIQSHATLTNPTTLKTLSQALKSASRSSAFLGLFIASFYYAVCLSRTRLGPKLFSYERITPQMWDSGLCVLTGCLACGWSVLVERPGRRQEIAFFVAPRAVGTLLPRFYGEEKRWREQALFAGSVAVVLSGVGKSAAGRRVRGFFGQVLERVLRE